MEQLKPQLITPYGGQLVDLRVPKGAKYTSAFEYAGTLPSIQLSERALCDLELLSVGAFSPLNGFMNQADYQSCLDTMRLTNGHIFPIPITLPVEMTDDINIDRDITLRDRKNRILGILSIEEIYTWDLEEVAQKVFDTIDPRHPIVAEMYRWGKHNLAGRLQILNLPHHGDFQELRLTPAETRQRLQSYGYENVVAFQTRNPLHRVHEALTKQAIERVNGVLLLHPVVGMTKPGDVDHYTRVRAYKTLIDNYYDSNRSLLSLLPLAMRMGGPREALWHTIIRRNYGANHFIIGRDHAGPGKDSQGNPFYGIYDAQELVQQHAEELEMQVIPFSEMKYLVDEDRYEEAHLVPENAQTATLSGTQVREDYLGKGIPLPKWFSRPEVATILSESYPPRHKQGACIWFTGLSGSGKTTTAEILTTRLLEAGRNVTVLDGDIVRTHLSKGLGFSKEDRDINIRRIGFVAGEIVRHGGIVICAAISPYTATRNDIRNRIGEGFIEVFVDTPLEVCEERDVKGMYAKARRGEIKGFTGIDDPYEAPPNAEITLETTKATAEANAQRILEYLIEERYIQH